MYEELFWVIFNPSGCSQLKTRFPEEETGLDVAARN
jgi:hypothetical protein